MKKIYNIRNIINAIIALIILILAFFQNSLWVKVIISPFIICSIAILGESIFSLLNKQKISNIFKYIFRVSLFTYIFGFLAYATYYAIVNKSYSLLIIVAIFLIFTIYFLKKSFFNN